MSATLDRLLQRVRALLRDAFRGAVIERRARVIDPAVGPLARRYLEAVGDALDTDSWAEVTRVGVCEVSLRAALLALREPSLGAGRAARDAELLRREIDVLLAEPRGAIAVTLRRFPAGDLRRARASVDRLGEETKSITATATGIVEARRVAAVIGERVREVRNAYQTRLPELCAALSLERLESRLADATTEEQVARLGRSIDECAQLLGQREKALEEQADEFSRLLIALGRPTEAGADRNLGRRVTALRDELQEAARRAGQTAEAHAAAAATAQVAHMDHGGGAPCFRRRVNPPRSSTSRARHTPDRSEAPASWRSLHEYRPVAALELPMRGPSAAASTDAPGDARARRRIKPEVLEAMRLRRQQSTDVVPGRRPGGRRPGDPGAGQ